MEYFLHFIKIHKLKFITQNILIEQVEFSVGIFLLGFPFTMPGKFETTPKVEVDGE
jgi:hypothetical protein